MTVELINTGSELLLGRILNSHQHWLGRRFADLGRPVTRQVTVPDVATEIESAVRTALARSDLVVTTGGLGPTGDDLTRDRIAHLLGRQLIHHPEIETCIRSFFESRGRTMPPASRVEANVPEGARVLANRNGTAPGLFLTVNPNPFRTGHSPSWLVMLPGPPRELHPMFDQELVPLLNELLPKADGFLTQTFKSTGLGESLMEDRLVKPLAALADGLEVGYCARVGEVDVRFVGHGPEARARIHEASVILRQVAGEFIFGEGDDTLESVLVRELTSRSRSLAVAESCTGGHLLNRLTNIPGASAILRAGFVPYANEAKTALLGVPADTIAEHGAVSEPVARAMAEGARRVAQSDYGLSLTGIAGPGGGTAEKPVGTVYIGLAGPDGTVVVRHRNPFDRDTFKFLTAQQAFEALRRAVCGLPAAPGRP